MKKHTMVYVDVGYSYPTRIAVIKNDVLHEVLELSPATEFQEIIDRIVDLLMMHKISGDLVKCHGFPAIERSVYKIVGPRKDYEAK